MTDTPAASDLALARRAEYGITRIAGRRIVHCTGEFWPFARTGGLAEAVRGLANFQCSVGQPTSVVMPYYRAVRTFTDEVEPVVDTFAVTVGGREERARVWRYAGRERGPAVYFVEHPTFFDRDGLYGEAGSDYPDNLRRFAFFSRAVAEVLPQVCPDAGIVHAHDWHAALVIPSLRYDHAGEPFFDKLGTVLTAHNAAYQGHFAADAFPETGLPWSMYDWRYFEWYGRVNVLKGGLAFADMSTTVSPNHAVELRTGQGGFGLHEHFASLGDRFVGILNGIDYTLWNPTADPYLTAPYSLTDLDAKRRNKSSLQRTYGLPRRARTPLIVMSARLVEQKGLDLILGDGLLHRFDAQFVFLGRGEPRYEAALTAVARQAPDRIAVPLNFTERLEHRLLAGADMLLMPSQFEPCGLTQMRAQRYGTLPIVRRVGGLSDTVEDGVTGFVFDSYEPAALRGAVRRAIQTFQDRATWRALVERAMREDFSWGPSAAMYQATYHRAIAARQRSTGESVASRDRPPATTPSPQGAH
jgi:starch synthase